MVLLTETVDCIVRKYILKEEWLCLVTYWAMKGKNLRKLMKDQWSSEKLNKTCKCM